MKNIKYMLFILTIVSSLAFGQFEKGTKLMDGALSYVSVTPVDGDGHDLDTITSTSLSLTYGQFLIDNLLVSGTLSYASVGSNKGSTNILIGADYFFGGSWYAGLGVAIPDEGDSEFLIGAGMLAPFRESSNVYLGPYLNYWIDSEILAAGVGLTLLF